MKCSCQILMLLICTMVLLFNCQFYGMISYTLNHPSILLQILGSENPFSTTLHIPIILTEGDSSCQARMRSLGRWQVQVLVHEILLISETNNLDELDDECYKSCDGNDNGPMLNEDDDYIFLGLHCIDFVRYKSHCLTF